METYYINIPTEKRDFFLDLMKELDFVQIFENELEIDLSDNEYIKAIIESEMNIEEGKVISHSDLKNEVSSWLK